MKKERRTFLRDIGLMLGAVLVSVPFFRGFTNVGKNKPASTARKKARYYKMLAG